MINIIKVIFLFVAMIFSVKNLATDLREAAKKGEFSEYNGTQSFDPEVKKAGKKLEAGIVNALNKIGGAGILGYDFSRHDGIRKNLLKEREDGSLETQPFYRFRRVPNIKVIITEKDIEVVPD